MTVEVRRTVTIRVSQAGGTYTFTGQVARAEAGLQVTIARLASETNRVTGVASTRTDAAGRYVIRTALPQGLSGYYALTGVSPTGALQPGRSRLYGLLVNTRPALVVRPIAQAVTAPRPVTQPRPAAPVTSRSADVDCDDFRTQREAQAFSDRSFARFGGFAGLDGSDDDGPARSPAGAGRSGVCRAC